MDNIIEKLPAVIEEASKSPLGLFALMVLTLGILGFFFFHKSSERTRISMFIVMFFGVAFFGTAVFSTQSFDLQISIPIEKSYKIIPNNDAFTSIRERPTTVSAERGRFYPESIISCGEIVIGERLKDGNRWRYCKKAGGYIYDPLIIPINP